MPERIFQLPELRLPLPRPSARVNLPRSIFGSAATFGGIERRLSARLASKGYEDVAYFEVRGGFAMVAPIERIDDGGRPFAQPARFSTDARGLCSFHLSTLIDCLLNADPGRYRVIVFIVTAAPVTTDASPASFVEVQDWLDEGGDFLPTRLARQPLSGDENISAIVYEFRRPSVHERPAQVSTLTAAAHLRAAGLISLP